MKKILYVSGLFLLFAMVLSSCTDCGEEEDIITNRCGTNSFIEEVHDCQAMLYKDTVIINPNYYYNLAYYSNSKTGYMEINLPNSLLEYVNVCNLSDYASKMNIPENGVEIILSGKKYESSKGEHVDITNHVDRDFVITSLTTK